MKFFLLSAVLLFTAYAPALPSTPTLMPPPSKIIRYLALGDSYTIGESVAESDRYPVQLARQLEQRNAKVDLTLIARTGWTVDELWQGIQQNPPDGAYDLVTLLIGVNDEYRGGDPGTYRQDFRFMLGKAIGYAGGQPQHVIVLSIPDWGVTPYAQSDPRGPAQIGAEIDAFNAVNRDESRKAGVRYVDVTPISRTAASDPNPNRWGFPGLLADDGLHPSGKMYSAWARLALPEILSVLGISH